MGRGPIPKHDKRLWSSDVKKVVIAVLNFYRKYLSGMKLQCCRFYPSCSQYAIDAIERHGLARGLFKASGRILRCHPFSRGGYDPA